MALDDRYVTVTETADTIGTGIRLHTGHDECYELRETSEADVRIHGEEGDWTTTIRFPETDLDPAYDRFDTLAECLENTYEESLITPAKTFLNDAQDTGTVTTVSGPITLRYDEQGENGFIALNELADPHPSGEVALSYISSGAAGGMATGAALGGPEGGVLGIIGGVVAGFGGLLTDEKCFPRSPLGYTLKGVKNTKRRVQRRRERKQKRADSLDDGDLWDILNEKHRLDAISESTRNMDKARHRDELQETGIEETVDALMDHHFTSFHNRAGVTATITTDSYGEALDFAATVLDHDTPEHERPSIYDDRDVFRAVFEAADAERQEDLVRTVYDRDDVSETVKAYLNDHRRELVERTGQNRSLEGDT